MVLQAAVLPAKLLRGGGRTQGAAMVLMRR